MSFEWDDFPTYRFYKTKQDLEAGEETHFGFTAQDIWENHYRCHERARWSSDMIMIYADWED